MMGWMDITRELGSLLRGSREGRSEHEGRRLHHTVQKGIPNDVLG